MHKSISLLCVAAFCVRKYLVFVVSRGSVGRGELYKFTAAAARVAIANAGGVLRDV